MAVGLLMEIASHPTGPEALRLSSLLETLIQFFSAVASPVATGELRLVSAPSPQ